MSKLNANGIDGVLFSLRSLFSGYGYTEYKMNKFEEYDLYVKNKDFLISDNVITFTDTNGKLLALKPDVTLSIVKNTKIEEGVKKVFYGENVYRVSSKSNGYKEIAQIGLECIGALDDYNVAEVLMLATQSLKKISTDFVLDVSPVGLIFAFINKLNLIKSVENAVYKCINEKNVHELKSILSNAQIEDKQIEIISSILALYGNIETVISKLKEIFAFSNMISEITDFENTLNLLPDCVKENIRIDCSSCENVKYYNGITFKGYIEGAPKAILSGGRYDGLLKIMGKNSGAIGFAIYPDEFDRMFAVKKDYDVDVIIHYGENSDKTKILAKTQQLIESGKTVTALKIIPAYLTYKEKIEI